MANVQTEKPETQSGLQAPPFTPPAIARIETNVQYLSYVEDLKAVKHYQDRVTEFFGPHKKRAYDAWQALLADEKKALAPAIEAEKGIKRELADFDTRMEQLRQAEERRLQEEARKREEQRRLDEAAALEREGTRTGNEDLVRQAQEIVAEPVETPTVQLESFTPRATGVSFRETYSARVVDMKKLIKWVAKSITNANLLQPNQTALNALARAQRENFKVDGVELVKEKGTTARR